MKKLLYSIILIVGASFFVSQSVEAQDNNSPIVIIKTPLEDIEFLQQNKPQDTKTPSVPSFVVKSRGGDFMLAIGGNINTILGFDIGNDLYDTGAGINFISSYIPVPAQRGQKSVFYINSLTSVLDFQFVGFKGTPNQIVGYMKFQPNGISPDIPFNQLYISYRRFYAGLTYSLMQDQLACPNTIDPQGPNGYVSSYAYQITYRSKSYNGFSFAASIEQPTFYAFRGAYNGTDYPKFDGHQYFGNASQITPDIPAWIQYEIDKKYRFRLTGLFRQFSYRNIDENRTRSTTGWGAMLSGSLAPVNAFTFYYQAVYGEGLGNYIQDLPGYSMSFIPDNKKPGKMKATPMMGVVLGATINATSKLTFNAMCSEARVWESGEYYPDYKYGLYVNGNMFYSITPYLNWGIEYIWGRRETWNKGGAVDNRLQTQIQFVL